MTTAATFDLVDLARHQTTAFERERTYLARAYRWLPQWLMSLAAATAAPMVLRFVDHHAQWLADRAVWFRGAMASLQETPADHPLDPDDTLRTALDRMEANLASIRLTAMDVAQKVDRTRGRTGMTTRALRRMAAAADELAAEVHDFKGVLQAHDANLDALTHARRVATTAQALDAELDRAFH